MSDRHIAPGQRDRAEAELARIAGHFDSVAGLAARHLGDGRMLALHADVPFPLASTVKVPIALTALQAVDHGRLSLAQLVEVQPLEFNPGGPLGDEFLHPGVALSVHNLLEPMITRSDNTATDVGFLTLPDGGTVAMAVYVKDSPLPPAGREDLIAELTRTAYDHFVLAGG